MSQKVQRYDFHRLKKFEVTQNGGVRIDALIGIADTVLEYPWGRELVPASTLFDPASLQSLEDCVVTVDHKKQRLAFADVKKHGVGYARSPLQSDNELCAKFVINDLDVVGRVDSGELVETSPGYDVRIENTNGVTHDGQKYDAIQRDRTYNHFALGAKDWSRGGLELRLDSRNNAYFQEVDMTGKKETDVQARLDAKIQEEIDGLKDRNIDLVAKNVDLQSRLDAKSGELDALRSEHVAFVETQKLNEANKAQELEIAVRDRVALETRAKQLGLKEPTGTTREIQEHCIRLDHKDLDLSKESDDYVRARFDALKIGRLDGSDTARSVIMQTAAPLLPKGELDEDDQSWYQKWSDAQKTKHIV